MVDRLKSDYSELVERAEMLSKRCVDESFLLMNKIMVGETQRGVSEAQSMARLTLLAYFFIPLSFTAAFFGMNVREPQGSDGAVLSVWVWFLVSIPVLLLAVALYFRDQLRFLPGSVKRVFRGF